MATDVPWPTSNNPGVAPGEGSGRLLNCYAYKDGAGPRWRPVPGLRHLGTLPDGEFRGALDDNNGSLYAVVGTSVLQINSIGGYTTLTGTVAGSGPVTMERNNKFPTPDITIVAGTTGYIISGGAVLAYPVATNTSEETFTPLPATVNSVAFLDGYFLWTTTDGTIWASNLNSTAINALSFAKAEARPDGLLRGMVYGQQFFAFGPQSIEVWQDAATSPFPLSRSTVIPMGLVAQWAIAGHEPGWAGPLIFVASDNSVRILSDYTPTRISNEDLERLIEFVADKTTLRASVYTHGGNAIWSLSCAGWTWEYNVTTGAWNERTSAKATRWKATGTVRCFGVWLAADGAGSLFVIDPSSRTEGDDPLEWGLDSGSVKQFPSRIQVPATAFDFETGQDGASANATAAISWSHDGGARWSNAILRTLSRLSPTAGRVVVNRMGLSTVLGFRLRFRIADPSYVSFTGARLDAVDRK